MALLDDPIDHLCADCLAAPGDPCSIEPEFHQARLDAAAGDAWADDWTGGVMDLDGDGKPGAVDFDDPSNWM